MNSLWLTPDRLLWHTRGKYWGYEFLCLPQGIDADWRSLVIRAAEAQGQQSVLYFSATLGSRWLVGLRQADEGLRDHASRLVSHTAVWCLPDHLSWKEAPASWFDQFYATVRERFSSASFYGLPDAEVRARWQRGEPIGQALRQEWRAGLSAVEIQPGPPPTSYLSWGDLGPVGRAACPDRHRRRLLVAALLLLAAAAALAWVLLHTP